MQASAYPAFLPAEAKDIVEPAAQNMLKNMNRVKVDVPSMPRPIDTAFAGPSKEQLASYDPKAPAIVLLHGFDSSHLEFRRLFPLLVEKMPTYAVDLVRCGLPAGWASVLVYHWLSLPAGSSSAAPFHRAHVHDHDCAVARIFT